MTENDKRQVILNSIERQISKIVVFTSQSIDSNAGILTGIIHNIPKEINTLLKNILIQFNNEITYNISLSTNSDLFALLTVEIQINAHLDNIIALLKLNGILDERIKHIFD